MQDSKFFKWIRLLPTQEQNDFLRFVEHAGGKNRQELSGLLSLFLEEIVRGKGLEREVFYKKWRPGAVFDANYLRKRMTRLQELLDTFLASQELALSQANEIVFLVKALERRGWSQLIENERRDAFKTLQSDPIDEQYFWQQLQLENAYLNLKLSAVRDVEGPSLQVPMNLAEELYLVQALRYACAARNLDRVVGRSHDYGLLPHLLPYIAQRIDTFNPLIRILYRVYVMFEANSSSAHFDTFLAELGQYAGTFTVSIQRELYQYAINHCISRLNIGEQEYAPRLGKLYQDTLENGVLLRNQCIGGDELKNMVALSARLGQIEVAENLLARYAPLLAPDADPAVESYCMVVILYHKREFGAVRRASETVLLHTRDPFYEIDVRIYRWRSSYELKEYGDAESDYDAFRMFLRRVKSLGEERITRYKGYMQFFRRLWRIMADPTDPAAQKKALEALGTELDAATDGVADVAWLKEKIAQALRGL